MEYGPVCDSLVYHQACQEGHFLGHVLVEQVQVFYLDFVQMIFVCSCCIIVIEVKVVLDKLKSVPRHCLCKYRSPKNSSR